MKISKEQHDYIYKDLYIIDYLTKILNNEYYYWRQKDEVKAKKFILAKSDLEYCRKEIYRKKTNQVRAINEMKQFENQNTQLSLNI